MAADPIANSGPAPVKPQPGEEFFRQSIADLSRRLSEREGRRSESEAQASAEARRRAMQVYELERSRRLRLMVGGAGAIVATACIAWFVVILGAPDTAPAVPAVPGPVATAEPAAPVVMASAVPTPQPPPPVEAPPPTAAVVETQSPAVPAEPPAVSPPPPAAQTAAAPPSEPLPQTAPTPAAPRPAATALNRNEIREVQKRLAGFGFNPGPIDGVAGRQTEVATQRYLEARGQPQMPPTEPQLLDQLRQDPAPPVAPPPQVVQRASRPDPGTAQGSSPPPARRSFDPFQPVKVAGAQITQWLQSAFR
jgi:hypothetical protein